MTATPRHDAERPEEAAVPTDLKSVPKNDLYALIAGALVFVLSLIGSYVTASVKGGGFSASTGTNAWTSYATLGVLLMLAATAIVAVKVFAPSALPASVPWNLVAVAAAALGVLLVILRAFTAGDGDVSGLGIDVNVGPGWSGYLLFLAGIALAVFSYLGFKESGERAPWDKQTDATTPPAA